jgi:hypothetical protein
VTTYNYYVSSDDPEQAPKRKKLYNGTDPADALAAWSEAVTEGKEYVLIEALRTER